VCDKQIDGWTDILYPHRAVNTDEQTATTMIHDTDTAKTDHSFVWMFIEVNWCRIVPSVRVVCIQAFHEQFTSTTNVLY